MSEWEKFITEIIPDSNTRKFLQRALGVALAPGNLGCALDQPGQDTRGLFPESGE